jgi:hypothetical protein
MVYIQKFSVTGTDRQHGMWDISVLKVGNNFEGQNNGRVV